MVFLRGWMLLALPAMVGLANAAEGRPNMKEWKETQKEKAAKESEASAKEDKMAAVKKVITMLADLKDKVLAEGEEEAKSYNKFACFCKDTMSAKSTAIQKGEDAKESITADIEKMEAKRKELDETIKKVEGEIEDLEEDMKKAEKERAKEREKYEENAADLSKAIKAIEAALQSIKASKPASLAQLRSLSGTIAQAVSLADALGLMTSAPDQQLTSLFLQEAPEVATEEYKFHSDSVIEMLEKLQKDFRLKKVDTDKAELVANHKHDMFMQEKTDMHRQKSKELNDAQEAKAIKQEEIADNSQQLTVISATILDDQEYLMELSKMCSDKAKTWDVRSKTRADELSALTAALDILKTSVSEKTSGATVRFAQQAVRLHVAQAVASSDDAMEAVEAAAEAEEAGAAPGFLQRLKVHKHVPVTNAISGRQVIVSLLRSKGSSLRSAALTALATEIAKDPFAKVTQLIKELITRLEKQSAAEAEQKGWCDKSIGDAKQKRSNAADKIDELNSAMAEGEAIRDKLVEELNLLDDDIKSIKKKQEEAEEMRKKEKAENEKTIGEAKDGLKAVEEAITVLESFYKKAAKSDVDLSLVQGPKDDAPDAGFEGGEAYAGAQGGASGALGLLEVIKSDFKRTVTETEKAEAEAAEDHDVFMTESGKSLAEKKKAKEEKTKQKDDVMEKLSSNEESMKEQVKLISTSIKELLELKDACELTSDTWEERVAKREEEMKALKQALCILDHFEQFGPDAAANEC